MDFQAGEMLLVSKPVGWTSFDVVNKIRYALKRKVGKIKVGHAGTLDPLATGLLIVCTGAFTKRIDEFMGLDKTYTGSIIIGSVTPSFDLETAPENPQPFQHITEADLMRAAQHLTGTIQQIPPVFSAIKKEGKALYEYARKGENVIVNAREVHVHSFKITAIELPKVEFEVVCSKGTYIRSLANDFGEALGTGGYLASLCRTAIGDYLLSNAWELDKLIEAIDSTPEISKT